MLYLIVIVFINDLIYFFDC